MKRRKPWRHRVTSTAAMEGDGENIYVVVNGVRIAKRGQGPQAMTWVSLEPGWRVLDSDYPTAIVIEHNGVRVQ